jgi:hypothetical protein
VVEFVSTEHTPRNLLIRAVRSARGLPPAEALKLAQQYVALRDAWGLVPHLEVLLMREQQGGHGAGLLPPEVVALLRPQS